MARVILNKRKLEEIQRECPGKAAAVVQKIAQDVEGYTKDHMNIVSPAPPGEPPGVDTGNLKNSIVAEPDSGDPLTWFVYVGAEYGDDLEYGTIHMAARPFFLPAIRAVAAMIPPSLLQGVVE